MINKASAGTGVRRGGCGSRPRCPSASSSRPSARAAPTPRTGGIAGGRPTGAERHRRPAQPAPRPGAGQGPGAHTEDGRCAAGPGAVDLQGPALRGAGHPQLQDIQRVLGDRHARPGRAALIGSLGASGTPHRVDGCGDRHLGVPGPRHPSRRVLHAVLHPRGSNQVPRPWSGSSRSMMVASHRSYCCGVQPRTELRRGADRRGETQDAM